MTENKAGQASIPINQENTNEQGGSFISQLPAPDFQLPDEASRGEQSFPPPTPTTPPPDMPEYEVSGERVETRAKVARSKKVRMPMP